MEGQKGTHQLYFWFWWGSEMLPDTGVTMARYRLYASARYVLLPPRANMFQTPSKCSGASGPEDVNVVTASDCKHQSASSGYGR